MASELGPGPAEEAWFTEERRRSSWLRLTQIHGGRVANQRDSAWTPEVAGGAEFIANAGGAEINVIVDPSLGAGEWYLATPQALRDVATDMLGRLQAARLPADDDGDITIWPKVRR